MLYLHGIGHFHPETVIDNRFLESLDMGLDSTWARERVGILERRTVLPLDYIRDTRNADPRAADESAQFSNADTAVLAARMAMERAQISPDQIGLVIAGGCAPQFSTPAESCRIAAALGLSATALDINSACSSFVTQCHFLGNMQPEALPDFVLVVNAENMTRTVDYNDPGTAVLWGDATSAAILSKTVPSHTRIVWSTVTSDPAGWNRVTIRPGLHFRQDGPAVQAFAIRKSVETIERLRRNSPGVPGIFVGHQANRRMLECVCRRAGVPDSQHLFNVDRFGNGGAAGAPSVLSQNWDTLTESTILMAVVGSGLTWGGMLIQRGSESGRTRDSGSRRLPEALDYGYFDEQA
jgi:3-oxoacyl-[acyl-carrier-protein] synthase-3